MLINLSEILSNPAKEENFICEIEMDHLEYQGEKYPIMYRSPVTLHAASAGKNKVRITGSFAVHIMMPCSRCLTEVLEKFDDIAVDMTLDFNESEEGQKTDFDEMSFVEGQNLDIEDLVYTELLPLLPMKVLCQEDCKGICSVCGINLNKNTCNCNHTVEDPRMSVIRDIFKNFKEV